MSAVLTPPTPDPVPRTPEVRAASGAADAMGAAAVLDRPQVSDELAAVDDPLEIGRFTRWVTGPGGERLAESSLQLSGLHCAACSGILEQAIGAVDGVRSVRVSPASQRASVCWDPRATQPSALIGAVRRAGYDAVPDAAEPARALRRREARQALWRLFVAAFCSMQVMMLATPSYVAGAGDLAPDLRQLLNWGSWLLSVPVLVFSSAPFFGGALRAWRTRRIGMDVPVALGIAITFVASSGATFAPDGVFGHEVYFDSMTMFVAFLLGARWVEMRVRHRAAEALEASLARLPQTAWRVGPDGRAEPVSVQRLRTGDRIRVPVGEAFAADGALLEGSTRADESLLTGESAPVAKAVGDTVVAGSINVGAPVEMRLEHVGADTRFEAIVSMMRSAASQRPALARIADRWAGPFLWTVLLLAGLAAAAWSVIDPPRAVWVAVAVLIVTCPCALSLAAPAALLAATRALSRQGVTVQRLDAIEGLARIDQAFFDKTGTLTADRMALREVTLAAADGGAGATTTLASASGSGTGTGWPSSSAQDAALARAAALAAWSTHPLSQALAAAARTEGLALPALDRVRELPGRGLVGIDAGGGEWRLGAPAWVAAEPTATPPDTAVALGVDGRVVAWFAFDEQLREGAAAAVAALRADGVRVTLLSGDRPARAEALARRIGIDEVLGGATPQSKLAALEAAQRAGRRVLMVGDGVNDAPVLARADVSLAMGQGALVSRAQADAVVGSGRPADIVAARSTARRALRIVHENLLWAAGYNLLAIPLALAGWLPPWAAGLGMAASSLLVVGNALRAAR